MVFFELDGVKVSLTVCEQTGRPQIQKKILHCVRLLSVVVLHAAAVLLLADLTITGRGQVKKDICSYWF